MDLETFRKKVTTTFGSDLHRASPASVRDFLDELGREGASGTRDKRFVIDETARSYEEVMRTFFSRVLELPPEEGVVLLWAVAFELAYAGIAALDADRFGSLFHGMDEESG
jgi:hypothetical protein